ncbi:MAG: hypothetical protein FVQ81_15165 [Candidatus Glassbacteria bacterium]|nr:hypothetical protein [Candidatus Glassbacteria bacterium]
MHNAVLMAAALMLQLNCSDWRNRQNEYREAAFQRSQQDWMNFTGRGLGDIPADSLLAILSDMGIDQRLEHLADSLAEIRVELARYEDILLAARDMLAGPQSERPEAETDEYFRAVRSYRRAERTAAGFEAELDSLREGLAALERFRFGTAESGPPEVHWTSPALVPVREACTTCHLPIENHGRVMLYPGKGEDTAFPEVMAIHDHRRFGCTVCHAGAAGSLDFRAAHGPDHLLRPFRPGKLALRSCGICHADRSPLINSSVAFGWPAACAGCHQDHTPAALADSSDNSAVTFPVPEDELRTWLLRHWAQKQEIVPGRDEFEEALAMLVSGDVRRLAVEEFLGGNKPAGSGASPADSASVPVEASCPRCGRTYGVQSGRGEMYCPVDGALLIGSRNSQ